MARRRKRGTRASGEKGRETRASGNGKKFSTLEPSSRNREKTAKMKTMVATRAQYPLWESCSEEYN